MCLCLAIRFNEVLVTVEDNIDAVKIKLNVRRTGGLAIFLLIYFVAPVLICRKIIASISCD